MAVTEGRSSDFIYGFLDQSLVNERIAYMNIHPEEKIISKEWYIEVARGMVNNFSSRLRVAPVLKLTTRSETHYSLTGEHFPAWGQIRKRCHVCKNDKIKTFIGCSSAQCGNQGF